MTEPDHPATPPDSVELTTEQEHAREDSLQDGLDLLASLIMEALSLEDLLGQVAAAARDAIPRVDGVGVSLLRLDRTGNRVQMVAADTDAVSRLETIQHDLVHEGPCIDAAAERVTVVSGALSIDPRWPQFGPRAAQRGMRSVASFPMLLPDGTVVGALNCYSGNEDAFDEHAVRLGTLFAAPAAVAVYNSQVLERAQTRARQLQVALVSRTTIDQAIGILRSRSGGTSDEGFAALREISQRENVKLAVVAERVVEEAVRRARARHVSG